MIKNDDVGKVFRFLLRSRELRTKGSARGEKTGPYSLDFSK